MYLGMEPEIFPTGDFPTFQAERRVLLLSVVVGATTMIHNSERQIP